MFVKNLLHVLLKVVVIRLDPGNIVVVVLTATIFSLMELLASRTTLVQAPHLLVG